MCRRAVIVWKFVWIVIMSDRGTIAIPEILILILWEKYADIDPTFDVTLNIVVSLSYLVKHNEYYTNEMVWKIYIMCYILLCLNNRRVGDDHVLYIIYGSYRCVRFLGTMRTTARKWKDFVQRVIIIQYSGRIASNTIQ